MISVKIFYLFILLGAFIFYIMYIDILALLLLVFLFVLPVLTFILFFYSRNRLDFNLKVTEECISKNKPLNLDIIIKNKCLIPLSRVDIKIKYKNELLTKWNEFVITTSVRAKNTHTITALVTSLNCGSITAKIDTITVYDLLLIFKKKYKSKKIPLSESTISTVVFPNIHPIETEVTSSNIVDYESDYMSKTKKGDDPSEIFDIHEYIEGDKLNRIHWKLSARSDEIYVKDFSLPVSNNTCLLINSRISPAKDENSALNSFDTAIESLASVSFSLCENEVIHNVISFDSHKEEFIKSEVSDIEHCRYAISEILKSSDSDFSQSVLLTYLSNEYKNNQRLIYFTTEINKQELSFILDNDIKNITILCSDEPAYECYPLPEEIEIVVIKNGEISKGIQQIRL